MASTESTTDTAWYRVIDAACEIDDLTNVWPPPEDKRAHTFDNLDRLARTILDGTARLRGLEA